MTFRVAIVDTNVVVAALGTSNTRSPVSQALEGMITARFPFPISDALIAEYRTVLARPKIAILHSMNLDAIETLLVELVRHTILVKLVPAPTAPDTRDQMLWDVGNQT